MFELDELAALKLAQHDAHVLAHAQFFAADLVVLYQLGALENVLPGRLQLVHAHVRKARLQALLDVDLRLEEVATILRQLVELGGSEFHLLIFKQAAHQLGARVFSLFAFGHLFRGQQHARLDLDQHGRHQQVFRSQLQVAGADLIDIAQILARHTRHRDVKDVEVLLANQIQQQVQRAFKGLQKDLQRVWWDVEVIGQRKQRLPVQTGHGHMVHHLGHGGRRHGGLQVLGQFGRKGGLAHARRPAGAGRWGGQAWVW